MPYNIEKEQKEWEQEKEILTHKNKIQEEKKALKKKLPTSKLLVFFLFLNCSIIELFTMFVTLQSLFLAQQNGMMPDFTPLVTLIGAVVGEIIGFAVYALKAKAENVAGGIEYEREMYALKQQNLINNGDLRN